MANIFINKLHETATIDAAADNDLTLLNNDFQKNTFLFYLGVRVG